MVVLVIIVICHLNKLGRRLLDDYLLTTNLARTAMKLGEEPEAELYYAFTLRHFKGERK